MTQQEESVNFFRLVRLLIDEGSDVLRDVLLKTIQPDTLAIFLQNNLALINNLKLRKVLFQDQYDLLTKVPVVEPEELDITLLCSIFRGLCKITPTNGWQTPPGPTDQGLGDDIYRLRTIRNTIYGHTTTTRVPTVDFQTLWTELEQLVIRLAKFGTTKKQQTISVRIAAVRSQDLDPESTTKESVEILSRWKKQDEETWDLIKKQLAKHDEQLETQVEHLGKQKEQLEKQEKQLGTHGEQLEKQAQQLEEYDKTFKKQDKQFEEQGEQLEKQDKQLRTYGEQQDKHGEQLANQEEQLGKHGNQLEKQDEQLGKQEEQLKDHYEQLQQQRRLLLKQDERLRTVEHKATEEHQSHGTSSMTEDRFLTGIYFLHKQYHSNIF